MFTYPHSLFIFFDFSIWCFIKKWLLVGERKEGLWLYQYFRARFSCGWKHFRRIEEKWFVSFFFFLIFKEGLKRECEIKLTVILVSHKSRNVRRGSGDKNQYYNSIYHNMTSILRFKWWRKRSWKLGRKWENNMVNQGTKAEVTWGRRWGMKVTMSPVSRKDQHHWLIDSLVVGVFKGERKARPKNLLEEDSVGT